MKMQDKQTPNKIWEDMKADYEKVFSTTAGKRVLEDLKKGGFIYKTTMCNDVNGTIFNEGKRETILHIIDMATPRPETKEQPKAITGE